MAKSESKEQLSEKIWLNYFNQRLYHDGVISGIERNKMAFKIDNRKSYYNGDVD